jgi:hypothetical protein
MKWSRQVVHVARKDLQMTRWYVVAYTVLVVLSTTAALNLGTALNILWPVLLAILGVLCVWVIVQADSPYRSDAFWASKPLSPTAVFAGKIFYIVVVLVGLGLVGQTIALLIGFRLDPNELVRIVAASTFAYGLALCMATIIAAITPDLRSVLLIVIGQVVVSNTILRYIAAKIAGDDGMPREYASIAIQLLMSAATIALIAQVYRTRSRRLGIWTYVGLTLVLPIVLSIIVPRRSVSPSTARLAPPQLQAPWLNAWRSHVFRDDGANKFYLGSHFTGGSPQHAYMLVASRVDVEREKRGRVEIPISRPILLNWPQPPNIEGVRWTGNPRSAKPATMMSFPVSRRQASALSKPNSRVVLRARIEVLEPRVSIQVPLVRGRTAVGKRQRLKILSAYPGDLRVSGARIGQHSVVERALRDFELFEYVVINRSLGQGAIPGRGGATTSGALVLAGDGGSRATMHLLPEDFYREPFDTVTAGFFKTNENWIAGAELLRIEWRSLGSYPVAVNLPLENR